MCSVHIMGNPKIFIDNELVITIHALQISIKFRRSKPEITFRYVIIPPNQKGKFRI